jgi:hypothetical protein
MVAAREEFIMRMIVAMASIGLFSAVAFGEDEMPAPKPSEEIKMLAKTMVGVWKCDGKSQMGGKEMTYKTRTTFTSALDGFYIAGKHEAAPKKKVMASEMIAFDPGTKTFTRTGFDAWGGLETATSKGPEGGVLTWTGKGRQMGMDVEGTQTVTEKGPNEWLVTGTQKGPGPMSISYELKCKK